MVNSLPVRRRAVVAALLLLALGAGAWLFFPATPRNPAPASAQAPATAVGARAPTKAVPSSGHPQLLTATPEEMAAPAAALDLARRLGDPRLRTFEFGRLMVAWLERDADAALAYVRTLPPGPEFTMGLLLALDFISQRDPDRALALAAELAVTKEQRFFYSSIFDRLAREDIPAALARLQAVPAGDGRENALRAVTDLWAQRDWRAALEWSRQLADPADRSAAVETALLTAASKEPLDAFELALGMLTGAELDRTLGTVIQYLTRVDLAAAADMVSLLPAGTTQTHAAIDVARELAAQNRSAAFEWIKSLPAGDPQRLAFNAALDSWFAADPAAASRHVAAMAAGPAQDAAADHLAQRLAAANPANAIAWAGALVTIASHWAHSDPAAASRWAATLAPGDTQLSALAGALSYWDLQDPAAARNFVSSLTGDALTRAATTLAPALAQRDPVAAVEWARTLSGPRAREAALAGAFARWLDNDAAAARAWLSASNLPLETQARLLNPPPP